MSKIIYSIGDSVVWGAELENKQEERFSHYVANHFGAIDCNNATAQEYQTIISTDDYE